MKRHNTVFIVLIVLLWLNILAWIAVFEVSQNQFLEVNFFDIDQGDAIFIESPEGHQILIDGGPTSAILEKIGREMPFYDRSIDLIILTHPEHDHIAGLLEVFKKYKVENILWTGVLKDTAEFKEWQRLIEEEQAQIKIAQTGQKIILPTRLGLVDKYMEVLFPFESLEEKNVSNTNNTSIIAKLVFNQDSFLFTGDAYKSVENKLLKEGMDLQSDVLKIGHHGSNTSTGEEFLREVLPEIAVISVGKENAYGHPHPEVIEILNKYDIKVLRSDQNGDIKILSNGQNILINNN